MLCLALVLPGFGIGGDVHRYWWAGAAFGVLAMLLVFRAADRVERIGRHRPDGLRFAAAITAYPVLLCVQLADPAHASAYVPMLVLPVAWCALYEDGRRLVASLVVTAVSLALPVLLVGAPGYPASSWRRSLLWLVVLVLVGPAVQQLVRSTRRGGDRLRASEERFRSAFADAPVPIAIVGVTGATRGVILQANAPLEQLLGFGTGELAGRTVAQFAAADDLAALTRALADVPRRPDGRGGIATAEISLLPRSGLPRWVMVSATVSRSGGGTPHCVCHVEDVTARHESERGLLDALEQQGVAATRLEAVAQARQDLVSAVSHDVRTPLATIGAYVELLETGDGGELTADQREMVDVIGQNVRRTYAITDDLLTLGRLEHAADERPQGVVAIGDLVARAAQSIAPQARSRHQDVVVDNGLGGVRVAGYEGQLDRLLGNLLTNAVKFTPEGGTITVRGRSVDGRVHIEVSDTGAGIPEAEQERIFERYYRSDSVQRRRVAGTGLGLAIAREIAALHGGTVAVRSRPGEGATFTLTLPALANTA